MSNENMEEYALSANKSEIIPSEEPSIETLQGEVILTVSEKTIGFDFNGLLAGLVQSFNMADAIAHIDKTMEYVVKIPAKFKEGVEAGKYLINENSKTGVKWPMIYKPLENGKREFVAPLPIKDEQLIHGNPIQSIAQSYHNMYMQQQLTELAESMKRTFKVVERIEQGQKADRIGKLMAGRDQILLSLDLPEDDRKRGIELGRSQIMEAQQQLLEAFKLRVKMFEPIPDSKLKRLGMLLKSSDALYDRDKEYQEIQEYFSLYLQATRMEASSYAICGYIDQAEKVYLSAEQEMSEINFDSLKTLKNIHKTDSNLLYYHAVDFVSSEKEKGLEEAKEYDYIDMKISGEKLLEAYNNGKQEKL